MMRIFAVLFLLAPLLQSGECFGQIVVYDNLAPDGWNLYYPTAANANGDEFGDEITLASNTPRNAQTFLIQYFASGFTGGEQVEVRFYLNDGGKNFQNADMPGTKIYDTGLLNLPLTSGANVLTLNNLNLQVPDSFTWTVQFTGIDSSKQAGLAVNHPPTIGSSYNDFWENVNGTWTLYQVQDPSNPTGPGLPTSFGAQMTAIVPEPSAACSAIAAALVLFALWRARASQRPAQHQIS